MRIPASLLLSLPLLLAPLEGYSQLRKVGEDYRIKQYREDYRNCGKILPTLEAYRIEKHGENYVRGNVAVAPPRENTKCEKILHDMEVWYCRWGAAKAISGIGDERIVKDVDALGTPRGVKRAQKVRASQVGGEAAKRRNVRSAWSYYRDAVRRLQAQKANMTPAETGYRAAHAQFVANGCTEHFFQKGKDPILDGWDKYR